MASLVLVFGICVGAPPLSGGPSRGRWGARAWAASNGNGPSKKALICADAFESVQRKRRQGDLVSAQKAAVVCAQEGCPKVLRPECIQWLRELDGSLPSVVLAAVDTDGESVPVARVTMDGKLLARRLDGRALAVNPGAHTFVFVLKDGRRVKKRYLVQEGRKSQVVKVEMRAGAGTPGGAGKGDNQGGPSSQKRTRKDAQNQGKNAAEDAPRAETPQGNSGPTDLTASAPGTGTDTGESQVFKWVAAGAGVAAATSALFFFRAWDARGDLRADGCAPNCPLSARDAINRDGLVSDLALGVALAGGATALWMWWSDRPASKINRLKPRPCRALYRISP